MTNTTEASGGTWVEGLLVEGAEAHAVERGRELLGERRADAEIGIGGEGRHDLLGVAAGARMGEALGLVAGLGLVLDGLQHLGVEHQLLDQLAAAGELEGGDLELEALVELVDGAVDAAAHPPAPERGREQAVDEGDDGERAGQKREPERDCHR